MLLKTATNEDIKAFADNLGYTFTDEDCQELRETQVFTDETVEQAVNDYLDAYER